MKLLETTDNIQIRIWGGGGNPEKIDDCFYSIPVSEMRIIIRDGNDEIKKILKENIGNFISLNFKDDNKKFEVHGKILRIEKNYLYIIGNYKIKDGTK